MKIDVVVVNYYCESHTFQCLQSILKTSLADHDLRFHVEDNGSQVPIEVPDGVKNVHISRNKSNLGFGRAVNAAVRRCDAPIILLANPDTRFCDGAWDVLLNYMRSTPSVGVLGPRVLNADGTLQGSARAFPTTSTLFFGRKSPLRQWFPRSRFAAQNVLDFQKDRGEPAKVDWVSGACMMIRRAAFEAVGGFDEGYFLYWEDADLCFRMVREGWQTVYYPVTSVLHLVGASRRRRNWASHLEFYRSAYRFFGKLHVNPSLPLRAGALCGLGAHFFLSLLWDQSEIRPLPSSSCHPKGFQ